MCVDLGYPGGNGPIFSFLPIKDTDMVFIGGAFNNYNAVVIWFSSNSSIKSLHNSSILSGDVATLSMVGFRLVPI